MDSEAFILNIRKYFSRYFYSTIKNILITNQVESGECKNSNKKLHVTQ